MFEDPTVAKRQLLKDKHSVLEGYVTEYLFERQFLMQAPERYTHGWWAAETFGKRFFFLVADKLNDMDRRIMQELSRQYPCWRAYYHKNTWYFRRGLRRLSLRQFILKYQLRARSGIMSAAADTRNSDRQNRCIDFFEKNQILHRIAMERCFADDILSVYFGSLVNIDFFVQKDNGQLNAIEVKFKFESKNGKFGINCGQYNLFEQLGQMGIQVQHWILYNGTHDDSLSIFGFLDSDLAKFWLSGTILTNDQRVKKTAPSKTSVYGSRPQEYYEFEKNEFSRRTPLRIQ